MKTSWIRALLTAGLVSVPVAAWSADEAEKPKTDNPPANAERDALFQRLDSNSDGVVTADEVPERQKRMFEQLLRRADKDSDGKLTKAEFAAAPEADRPRPTPADGNRPQEGRRPEGGPPRDGAQAEEYFRRLDANNDGKVTRDELPEERREGFDRLVQNFDENKDGALSMDEFRKGIGGARGGAPQPGSPQPPRDGNFADELFRRTDANNDGKLTRDEVPEDKREKFDGLVQNFDENKDGVLSLDEFRKGLMAERGDRPQPPAGEPRTQSNPDGSPRRPEGQPGEPPRRPEGQPGEPGRRPGAPGEGRPGAEFIDRLFQEGDKNNDGKLSKEELPEQAQRLRENFDRIDANKDGFIDKTEVQQVFAGMRRPGEPGQPGQPGTRPGAPGTPGTPGQPNTPGGGEFFQRIVQQADKNGDGKLSKDEIPEQMQRLRDNFDELDKNKDGVLDQAELQAVGGRTAAGRPGQPGTNPPGDPNQPGRRPAAGGGMLQQFDKNNDGKLSKDEIPEQAQRLRERFDELDKNKDGVLDAQELQQAGPPRRPENN